MTSQTITDDMGVLSDEHERLGLLEIHADSAVHLAHMGGGRSR